MISLIWDVIRDAHPGGGAVIWILVLAGIWLALVQRRGHQAARLASTLGSLARAGRTPREALRAMRDATFNPSLARRLDQACLRMDRGESLPDALIAVDAPLPASFLAGLRLSEEAGMQARYLELAAGQIQARAEIRNRVVQASMHPLFLLCSGSMIALFMVKYIVPTFVNLLKGMHLPLPACTRWLIAAVKVADSFDFTVASGTVALVLLAAILHAPTRRRIDAWLEEMLPPWRSYRILAICEQIGTEVGVLLASGLSIPAALDACARHLTDARCAAALRQAARDVDRGEALSESLARQKALPPLFTWSVALGERGEHLDEVLLDLSGYYREKMARAGRTLASLWEPVASLVLGAAVFVVALAFWLPLYMILGAIQ